ncbi:hypothetical protein PENTCL1PPCAC_1915, partial [Pristionchus entomophagus]
QLLLFLSLADLFAAIEYKQGNDCTDLDCSDRPGTACQMVTYDCNIAPCPPSAHCVPKANSCATKRCAAGMDCVARLAFCSADDSDCKHRPTCVKFPKCGANEEYRECNGEGKDCEATCTNEYPYCSGCGSGGCICKHGFIRHSGKCIKKEQCPDPDCPVNMVWSKCPGNCDQPTCRSILLKHNEKCVEGCGFARCICKPGLVKNDDDVCIRRETCPKKFDCSSPFEVKKQCSSMCEPSCWNRDPVCNKRCGPPKCQCKPGYVRDNGICLDSIQCPHIDPTPPQPQTFEILKG